MGRVQVDVVRRAANRPPPHDDALPLSRVDGVMDAAQRSRFVEWATSRPDGTTTVADLFCGAGGLSWGLEDAGFTTIVGVDDDEWALETHRSHHAGLHLDWDLHDPEVVTDLGELLRDAEVDVIAGGPPCQPFSRAGRSLIRKLERDGRRAPDDARRDLWESFLRVVFLARPRAALMENVPGMATEEDMEILRLMVDRLEARGYGVNAQVVDSNSLGVPQHRKRLILVALRHGARFRFPDPGLDRGQRSHWMPFPTIWDAIGDLPATEAGWSVDGVHDEDGSSTYEPRGGDDGGALVRHLRTDDDGDVVFDHYTRSVREDDQRIFASMRSDTRYDEIAEDLRRYRDDIFTDKYKRLDEDEPSRTITAHLARDGYWYIHPRENRTLTVREAARIQTFPDRFRFAGPPTSMFRQIGNAVPPVLAERLGVALLDELDNPSERDATTIDRAAALASWWREGLPTSALSGPLGSWSAQRWLRGTPWQVLVGEILLNGMSVPDLRWMEPLVVDEGGMLSEPRLLLAAKDDLVEANRLSERTSGSGHPLVRRDGFDVVCDVALAAAGDASVLSDGGQLGALGVPPGVLSMLRLVHPGPDDDPVISTSGVRRVAGRVMGLDDGDLRGVAGRIEVMRLVGVVDVDPDPVADGFADEYRDAPVPMMGEGDSAAAHLGLIAVSRTVCGVRRTHCRACPLSVGCATALRNEGQPRLQIEEAR